MLRKAIKYDIIKVQKWNRAKAAFTVIFFNWRFDMRTFIRHPSDIPIEVHPEDSFEKEEKFLHNVSIGGLSFSSDAPYEDGKVLRIRISFVNPAL